MTFQFRHLDKSIEWHITYYLFWIRRLFRKKKYYSNKWDRKLLYEDMLKKLEFNYNLHKNAQQSQYLIQDIVKLFERTETRDFYDYIMCLPELVKSIDCTIYNCEQYNFSAKASTKVYYKKYTPVSFIQYNCKYIKIPKSVNNDIYHYLKTILNKAIVFCN